jgi:phytoene dehydrogenase-like protein
LSATGGPEPGEPGGRCADVCRAKAVAVVGSGAAGLAAAFRLQEAGHRVRLFERNTRLGGKMLTTRREGFTLEEGPSAMAGAGSRWPVTTSARPA